MRKANKRVARDKENPAFTAATRARAKRVEDIPELAFLTKRKPGERGPQRAPTKKAISIRVDANALMVFKATGRGWQSRLSDVIADAAQKLEGKAGRVVRNRTAESDGEHKSIHPARKRA